MSQAILISDNEVINSLYEVNLRAYVATNVTIKPSVNSAIELLNQSPNVDAVICFAQTKGLKELEDFFNSSELETPLIILGSDQTSPLANCLVVKNKYDIRSLLQAMAKILEVTAKEMASMRVPKFFPIPLNLFSQMELAHCDVFFRKKKENFEYDYFKIIEKDAPLQEQLQKYKEQGVEHLYVDADERLRFINKASKAVIGELDREDLRTDERMEITQQGMGIVAQEIFESQEISDELAEVSKACIASIEKICKDVPKLKSLLSLLLENQADYCYRHSVLTTYIANQIIGKISWGSLEQQNKVAFSLFFHDIYLVPIYKKYKNAVSEEDLLFMDEVSEEDKQTVVDHAKLAGQLVKTFPRCPIGADMIITQHHGMTSGQGFAVNFKDDISPLSKIMIIAEDVATSLLAQLGSKEGQKKLSLNKEQMMTRLQEKYRSHTYRKIIEAFGETKL